MTRSCAPQREKGGGAIPPPFRDGAGYSGILPDVATSELHARAGAGRGVGADHEEGDRVAALRVEVRPLAAAVAGIARAPAIAVNGVVGLRPVVIDVHVDAEEVPPRSSGIVEVDVALRDEVGGRARTD